ncbi:hypothetical protein ACNR9Q_01590 [Maribacter sp. X9]|uniref:hypothetical protein n=1 Tax=Maribacter sp. X9 TaxID=3402159 RepID=UPI003AF3918C
MGIFATGLSGTSGHRFAFLPYFEEKGFTFEAAGAVMKYGASDLILKKSMSFVCRRM